MQPHPVITAIPGTLAAGHVFIAMATGLLADVPAPPSAAQLERFQQLSSPVGEQTGQLRHEAQKALDKRDRDLSATDARMRSFLGLIGQENLLAQNNSPTPSAVAPAGPAAAAPAKDPDHAGKAAEGDEAGTTIKIKCDGGIYFDSEGGIFVYQKNIRLTESGGSFELRCDDEFKLLLAPPSPDPEGEKNASKKDKSFADLGDLTQIIASGNVRIAGKNDRGVPFLATGDIASYDATTGEMILKGGRPTLQQTANQYLQAQEPGQWIKIQMQDKRIRSIITSEGKWEMQTTTGKKSL